ncbi:OmpA family protein [Pararhodobacter sp. SW119]|uniref:OmpA family protein n=1 Tax=Pararhodobacter sp. SW119 TaxID=2780075 RepID=UPI001AE04692|nr:OmpA family protein [Pararhodobacter sp. SW119]
MARRKAKRRATGRAGRKGGISRSLLWGGLIAASVAGFGVMGWAAWSINQRPGTDAATLCPDDGPVGAVAILIDASGPLSRAQEARLRHELGETIAAAPTGTMISLGMVSDREAERGARLARCKPVSAAETSTVTGNPAMVGQRFDELFANPVERELSGLLGLGQGAESARMRQQREIEASLADTGASVVNTGTELVITLPEQITFDSGSAQLRAGPDRYLATIARSLAEHPETTVQIVGHSDNVGSLELNQALSEARANAVAEILVREGADRGRIRTLGRAYLEPVASNDSDAGRRQNRRVELIMASRAPIMESLQALVAETPLLVQQAPRGGDGRDRRIVIVSDMLQNSDVVSFYRGQEWADFRASRDFARLGQNLNEVAVEILRLPRDEPAIRDPGAVDDFWARYLDYQGIKGMRLRTIGDL